MLRYYVRKLNKSRVRVFDTSFIRNCTYVHKGDPVLLRYLVLTLLDRTIPGFDLSIEGLDGDRPPYKGLPSSIFTQYSPMVNI